MERFIRYNMLFFRGIIKNSPNKKLNGTMFYGQSFTYNAEGGIDIWSELSCYEVDPNTLGVFIGNYKNIPPIWEGDIIHIKTQKVDKDFGVVSWHKDGYFYVDDSFGKFPKDRCKPIGDFVEDISREFSAEIYVNGNIHERPEVREQIKCNNF